MIKKILSLALLLILSVSVSKADEEKAITLSEESLNQPTTVVFNTSSCEVEARLRSVADNGLATVSLTLKNAALNGMMFIFNRSYTVNELKAMKPSIRYHKAFTGFSKSIRVSRYDILNEWMGFDPGQQRFMPEVQIQGNDSTIEIPVYQANAKGKKYELVSKSVLRISLHVDKTDRAYARLKAEGDMLIAEMDTTIFCTNSRHRGQSSSTLQTEYRDNRIKPLLSRISAATDSLGLMPNDEAYVKYQQLTDALSNYRFQTVTRCRHDGAAAPERHKCNYCNLSPSQLARKMQAIQQQLKNREITKQSAVQQAQAICNCADKNKKHASVKSSIDAMMNQINAFQ